jgi:hypothetical protein
MASKAKDSEESKRLNRVVGVAEALQKTLDPAFRKRGFASRDLVTHWAAMAPSPYDGIAAPDRLAWPRGARQAGGATLYLRCAAGHALALQHEGPKIASAINRYFGYVLIEAVRISAAPFSPASLPKAQGADEPLRPDPVVDAAVEGVEDEGLRDALRRLGRGIKGKA